jgi:nitroimidazol reductase NimA-like FMN-containing flavoprotein (pyridoxamine 5'-phosphate oxidase superfamily)
LKSCANYPVAFIFVKIIPMFGKLSESEIETVLHQQVVGRIGCHHNGTSYVVPTSYAYDGKSIYGISQEGMKLNMMRHNKKICFEVDAMVHMASWKSVICQGEFEELSIPADRLYGLQLLHNRILPLASSDTTKLSAEWPFAPSDINTIKGIVFRIRLTEKSGRFENN